MISDPDNSAPGTTALTTADRTPTTDIAPALTVSPRTQLADVPCGTLQPIADVAAYLEIRKPQMHWEFEEPLMVTLPGEIRREVKALQSACSIVLKLVKKGLAVQPACKAVIVSFRDRHWNLKTFRARYDAWVKREDWTVFVNRAKAGGGWRENRVGLPEAFLFFCAGRIGRHKRNDARHEALRSIGRQWKSGRTFEGKTEPIPGYGFREDWLKANPNAPRADIPPGWSYSNILRQLKDRKILCRATYKLMIQGTAAANIPDVLGTREGLRFLERVQFDDVKTDWRILDLATGQSMDLWLLIARDVATTLLLGFGMRPARVRDDGTQEHLKLLDMKQLCGWILERYGLPPYLMTWVIENGTATLSTGSAAAIAELLQGRVIISYASMVGAKSPAGYFEKRIGNSKSKASLESHNRGLHMIGSALPGQTGPHYAARPTDLAAREKESREIVLLSDFLPEHLKGQCGFSLLTTAQARENMFKIIEIQNRRDDHSLEGFDEIVEWWDGANWNPQNTAPNADVKLRRRKEMPVERAARLVREVEASGQSWTRISPDVITAFYEHLQRPVKISKAGEIEFQHEGKLLVFVRPDPNSPIADAVISASLLGYFHPDDPCYLHLTDGCGAIVGTWLLRSRVKAGDREALAQAMAYQQHALKAARDRASELTTTERDELTAMRVHNNGLHQAGGFIEVAPAPAAKLATAKSSVASGLKAVAGQRNAGKQAEQDFKADAARARSALLD